MIDAQPILTLAFGIVVGAMVASLFTGGGSTDTPATSRERLQRDTQWTKIIDETSEGYGTAVLHIDDGVEICSFNNQDEIFQSTWVSQEELATLADELSARACELGRGDQS